MKQFVIQVPENKASFFLELIHSLGFSRAEDIEESRDLGIAEEHKELIRDRIATVKDSDFVSWDVASKQIKLD